jgi:hypothetical protein
MLGDLGVSTLRLIKIMILGFLLFFEHQTSQAACFNARLPLFFFVIPTCWETSFSSCHYWTYFFIFSFLDHHTGHPARHDARILIYECILDALRIFSLSFRSIGSQLPIGRHSTSLHLARLK